MHYKSNITKPEDGGLVYSIAIHFSSDEIRRAYLYFLQCGVKNIPCTPNSVKFIKDIGERDGLQSEMTFLRNMVFEAEFGKKLESEFECPTCYASVEFAGTWCSNCQPLHNSQTRRRKKNAPRRKRQK